LRSIKEKVLLNFGSTVLPMTAGLVAIPILIENMGVERFGLLSIAWMIVGYFGLLDMGLGRALTQRIASNLGAGKVDNIKPIISFSLKIVLVVGITSATALFLFSDYLVFNVFDITETYREETKYGMYWVALTIPLVVLSTALFGILEGFQYFGWTAVIRLPLNILMFFAPVAGLWVGESLDIAIFTLFVVRFLTFVALSFVIYRELKGFQASRISKEEKRSLLTFGGWISLSNLVSPIMVYFDRFYIASVLGASLVAYYTTPLDLLVKATLIPFAIISVMFSFFATHWHEDWQKVVDAYKKTLAFIFAIMLAFLIVVYFGAEIGLRVWIDQEFSSNSYQLAQILAIGIFFNGLAMVPFALVQGIGRSDLTAKFHLFELPIFIFMLVYGVAEYGLIGAAWAWTARVTLDCALLISTSLVLLKGKRCA
jgi:O-antigen/teichoic acid export membrane protein